MPGKRGPEDVFAELDEVQRRLRNLETAPRLTSASIKNGLIQILDDSGNVRAKFGKVSSTRFGLQVLDDAGNEVLDVGQLSGTSFGLQARDGSGQERVRVGKLGSGVFGSRNRDSGGTIQFETSDTRTVPSPSYTLTTGSTSIAGDTSYTDRSPQMDFEVVTDKLLIIWGFTCDMEADADASVVPRMSYRLTQDPGGAGTIIEDASDDRAAACGVGGFVSGAGTMLANGIISATGTRRVSGLASDTYRLDAFFKVGGSVSFANAFNRFFLALPLP